MHVPFDFAVQMWPALEPLFSKVTSETNGCFEPIDILAEVKTGNQQLWVAWDEERGIVDAVATTAIFPYPRRTACRVLYIAGAHMENWLDDLVERIERFAKSQGATLLEGFFREGWVRVWPGGRKHGVGLVKDLSE